jgi:hypothetical protein
VISSLQVLEPRIIITTTLIRSMVSSSAAVTPSSQTKEGKKYIAM